jgi:hypothetical protein
MQHNASKQERIANGGSDRSLELITEAVNGYHQTLGTDHPDTQYAISLKRCRDEDIASFFDKYNSCFSPESKVLLADGVTTKCAKDIQIGDKLCSLGDSMSGLGLGPGLGGGTTVVGHIIQKQDKNCRELIQIGDMLISKMHRIQLKGIWIRPSEYPNAISVTKPCELHNFIVDNLVPIVVNDIIVSTIGTFYEGLHDMKLPNHALWASKHIATVFQQHPQWPLVVLDAEEDNFLKILKHKGFANEYMMNCPMNTRHVHELLTKYGWNRSEMEFKGMNE